MSNVVMNTSTPWYWEGVVSLLTIIGKSVLLMHAQYTPSLLRFTFECDVFCMKKIK